MPEFLEDADDFVDSFFEFVKRKGLPLNLSVTDEPDFVFWNDSTKQWERPGDA